MSEPNKQVWDLSDLFQYLRKRSTSWPGQSRVRNQKGYITSISTELNFKREQIEVELICHISQENEKLHQSFKNYKTSH